MANNYLTGNIRQHDDLGTLRGDICLADDWQLAKLTDEYAWLDGKTNGRDFTLTITTPDEQHTKIGELTYSKLPHEVNGLVGYGKLKVKHNGKATAHVVAVFIRKQHKLVQLEDGTPSTIEVKSHAFRAMTKDEVAQYLKPVAEVATGNLM